MERYFFYLLYLLLGCSLCGCSRKQAPKQTQDPDTETTIPYVDTIAAPVPPAPAKSRTARYLDSLGFVNIAEADSSIAIDLMYTRADNFTGTLLYEDLKEAYLHPDAMKSLKRAQRLLKEQYPGYSLIVYDAARPLSVQQKMWNVVKGTSKYIYVSNPSRGGGLHNYGLAVDISILDDKGTPLPMGTPVDHLGREAHITEEAVLVAQGKLTEQERENRLLLRQVMKEAGFHPLPSEWWHSIASAGRRRRSDTGSSLNSHPQLVRKLNFAIALTQMTRIFNILNLRNQRHLCLKIIKQKATNSCLTLPFLR